jgi:hypothetical protein
LSVSRRHGEIKRSKYGQRLHCPHRERLIICHLNLPQTKNTVFFFLTSEHLHQLIEDDSKEKDKRKQFSKFNLQGEKNCVLKAPNLRVEINGEWHKPAIFKCLTFLFIRRNIFSPQRTFFL